jgi:2'-hydroxyisoflavone reductase
MNRRTFLQMSLSSGAAVWLSGCTGSARQTSQPKKLLILGGTNFLGPAIVELALLHGHELTLFNRGITRPYLFPGVEKLRGNRALPSSDLKALEGERKFDAVIDVWPQQSGLVRETAELLADRTDYYFFVSSIAAYRDFSRPGLKEDAPTHVDDPGWYGSEKAESERIVQKIYGERSGIARCHAIVGYRDPGTSFHYWIRRFAEFDEVLAPGSGKDPVQFSDVRDVAAWILGCAEAKRSGIHNICGPAEPLTLRALLEGTRDTVSKSTRLVWADADFLRRERGLQSFTNFPLWAPLDEDAGFYQIDTTKSVEAGATFRPLEETAREAWTWFQSSFFDGTTFPIDGVGMSRETELAALAAWADASRSR